MTTEKPLTVAIQGEKGAFSHQAAIAALGRRHRGPPAGHVRRAVRLVVEDKADRALVPIENSLHGSIHENYDRLKSRPLHIVGETQLRIRQCLIARPGSSVGMIRRVASHPVALAQCRRFFAERPQVEAVTAYDTAGAVQDLMKGGLPRRGPSPRGSPPSSTARQVLLDGIEDDPENYTRFLLLAREAGPIEAASKTSIVFVLDNKPGALYGRSGSSPPATSTSASSSRGRCAATPGSTRSTSTCWATRGAWPGRRSRSSAAAAASCASSAPTRRASAERASRGLGGRARGRSRARGTDARLGTSGCAASP